MEFDASRRGNKWLKYSRDKHEGTNFSREGGGETLLCDPGSELHLRGGRDKIRTKMIKIKKKKGYFCALGRSSSVS